MPDKESGGWSPSNTDHPDQKKKLDNIPDLEKIYREEKEQTLKPIIDAIQKINHLKFLEEIQTELTRQVDLAKALAQAKEAERLSNDAKIQAEIEQIKKQRGL